MRSLKTSTCVSVSISIAREENGEEKETHLVQEEDNRCLGEPLRVANRVEKHEGFLHLILRWKQTISLRSGSVRDKRTYRISVFDQYLLSGRREKRLAETTREKRERTNVVTRDS
jgi:hypothetical protein